MSMRPPTGSEGDHPATTKGLVLEALATLPDDADFDDIIERLQFVYEVQRGIEDADAGRVVTQEEARQRMVRWLR